MSEFKADPRQGVFDSPVAKDLTEALQKADAQINQSGLGELDGTDREEVAKRIISEALGGETQPDLASRSAVAKMLLERKAATRNDLPGEVCASPSETDHPSSTSAGPSRDGG